MLNLGRFALPFLCIVTFPKHLFSLSELKAHFMRLVGVFNLQISDVTVLNDEENEDYSFELAFLEASLTCNLDAIKFLLVIGVNVDYTNEKGKTALLVASEQGHKEMVNCLIAANADVNASDVDSRSALIIASENNDVELAQILLNAKANPNHQRNDGSTSLHIASYNNYYELAVMLIKFGADPLFNMSGSPKPTLAELDGSLKKLVKWKQMAIHLPNIDASVIETIKKENQNDLAEEKLALCIKWLSVYPDASWEDVVHALREAEENVLANEVEQVHVSNKSNKKLAGNRTLTDTVMVEEEVVIEIESLYSDFLDLAMQVETEFKRLSSLGKIKLDSFLAWLKYGRNVHGIAEITNIETIDEFFNKVSGCCTFLDCDLLEDIANKLPDALDLRKRLRDHKRKVRLFRQTTPIEKLKNKLAPLIAQFRTDHTSLMIVFKLQNAWGQKPIALFETLLNTLYPKLSKIEWNDVEPGSICITFSAHNNISKALISSCECKIDFMRLVGVFNLQISDVTVLNDDENEDYSFELAFLEASLTCNLDAIKFLLVIGVNVDYADEKEKTALLVASQQGHKEMVNCLIAANADVNASDVDSQSALIIASENNDVKLAQILLNAKANPNHQINDGNTSLHIASYNNYNELAVMLIEFGADPLIENTKGDTPFLYSVRNNMLMVVKLILPNVSLSVLPSVLLPACRLGYVEMISYLLQHIDPPSAKPIHLSCANGDLALVAEQIVLSSTNVDSCIVLGITPLMIASSCGHAEIVDCLIQAEAHVNCTDQDGFSPLAYAITGSKSIAVVECLLQAGADPSIQVEGITLLQMAKEKCQSADVTHLLLQYIALHLYNMFSSVVDNIQEELDNDIKENKVAIQEIVNRLEKDPEFSHITRISMANTCSELFITLKPHYDFLSWKLISFLYDHLKEKKYFSIVQEFEESVEIAKFSSVLTLLSDEEDCFSNCSEMTLTLEKQWDTKSLFNLRGLTSFLFSSTTRVMSHLTVNYSPQTTVVKYRIPKSRKLAETIKSIVLRKHASATVLGIIEIAINSEPVLSIGKQKSFSFESAALNAVCKPSEMSSNELLKLLKFLFRIGGVNPNIIIDGPTALLYSVVCWSIEVVNLLLQNGASPCIGNSGNGITPLIIACAEGYLEKAKVLIKADKSTVNQTTFNGRPALLDASLNGHTEIVRLLLENGSNPNIIDNDGRSALMAASLKGYTETVQLLLEAGADPNIIATIGVTALMIASQYGNSEVVKLLLARHADYRQCASMKNIPTDSFGFACCGGNKEIVHVFLNVANLSPTSLSRGWYIACLYNKPHLIEYLVHSLSKVSSDQRELVVACVNRNIAFIKSALPKFSPDAEFVHGVTLLMIACSCGHSSIVKTLVDTGANVHKVDEFGLKAVDYCDKHSPIPEILGFQQNKETVDKRFNKEEILQSTCIFSHYNSKGLDHFKESFRGQSSVTDVQ